MNDQAIIAKRLRQAKAALKHQVQFLEKMRLGWNLDEKDINAIAHQQKQVSAAIENCQ